MSDNASEPVPAPVRQLTVDGAEVTLLGTAHISRRSAEDVREALAREDFDAVAVELCRPRLERMTDRHDWRDLDLLAVIRSGRAGMVAAQLALSAYQKRLGEQLGVEPGSEMAAAVAVAREQGLPLWLVDRDIGITMKRVVRGVPWYQRWTLITGILTTFLTRSRIDERQVEALKQGDMLESTFTEFAESSPALYEALVAERDRYMAARLREQIARERPRRVLVVIGAGHLDGLAKALEGDADPLATQRALEAIPPRGRFLRLLPWLIVAVIFTGFAIGFSRSPELGRQLVVEWVLINGTLTAVGALLARAHPLSIGAAFLAAPLTSLNPTVGAGMVIAAVQTAVAPPRMQDFDTVREDIVRLAGWWRNRVSRILLVCVFCTVGSAAATYIAGFRIFERLAS